MSARSRGSTTGSTSSSGAAAELRARLRSQEYAPPGLEMTREGEGGTAPMPLSRAFDLRAAAEAPPDPEKVRAWLRAQQTPVPVSPSPQAPVSLPTALERPPPQDPIGMVPRERGAAEGPSSAQVAQAFPTPTLPPGDVTREGVTKLLDLEHLPMYRGVPGLATGQGLFSPAGRSGIGTLRRRFGSSTGRTRRGMRGWWRRCRRCGPRGR